MKKSRKKIIAILAFLIVAFNTISAISVTGRVISAGKGLSGVVVTDGYNFALTDKKGEYRLETDKSAKYVYLSVPSGYNSKFDGGTVKFYEKLTAGRIRYDFNLIKKSSQDTDHSFIVFADPQIWAGKEFKLLSKAVEDINETIKSFGPGRSVHAICSGDIVSNDHSYYGEYNRVMSRLNIPVYNAMGNHDMTLYGRAMEGSEAKYNETFGPEYYSYNVGKVHYITLNDNFYIGRDYFYIGYLDERQLAWLEKDLSYVPKGSTVMVNIHIPASCEPSDRAAFQYGRAGNTMTNHRSLYNLLKEYNAHVLSGHTHTTYNQQITPTLYEHVTPALSGAWWQGALCTDGTPSGYGVYNISGNKVEWYYKSTGYDKEFQMKLYDGEKYPELRGYIVANIWNSDPSWSVQMYEDGVLSSTMERFRAYDPDAKALYSNTSKLDHKWIYPSESDHFYRAKAGNSNSVIEIIAKDRFGNIYREVLTRDATSKGADYDVVVIGGGTSGVAAGIESARGGATTLIAEEHEWLGGMLTSAGVSATDGNFKLKGGIWGEFRDSLVARYGSEKSLATGWVSNILFEPSVGDKIFKNIAAKERLLSILYGTYFLSAEKAGEGWSVTLNSNGQIIKIKTKILIDATELGDVAKACGVKYEIGMDSKSVTGEDMAPEHANGIIQDLTYAMVLKEYPYEVTPVKPEGYDPSLFYCSTEHEKCINPKEKKRRWSKQMMITYGKLPNNKYMINWPIEGNDFYVNVIEMSREERIKALEKAKNMSLCFLYYIQTELGYKRLGIADDEFPTKDRLPFIAYHRESRRVDGVVRFTVNHITHPYEQPQKLYRTAAGVGDYPVDQHHTRYPAWDSLPDLHIYPVPSYGFPLGIVIPKGVENLIVAEKSVSVTNLVNGSTRLQPVVLQIGQASGALAALAVKSGKIVSKVPVRDVQSRILKSGGYLLPYLDLKPGDRYFEAIQKIGVTGIIKGKGMNKGWENQTWFFADSLITRSDLKEGLSEVYNIVKEEPDGSKNVTLDWLVTILSEIGGGTSQEIYYLLDREKNFLAIASDKRDTELTRAQVAAIIDRVLNPFGKEIDHFGNFINQ